MKIIKCVNNNGMTAEFTYEHDKHEYFLVSCDGIYSMKNTITSSKNATADGTTYNGESLEQRNIVITTNIIRNHRKNREYLSRVFKNGAQGTFIHEENGDIRKINYRVESIDVEEKGIIRAAVISLICTDPYFTDGKENKIEMSSWHDNWEFIFEIPEEGFEFGYREFTSIISLHNESTNDLGMVITLTADAAVKNPMIFNQTTNEKLKLLCTMDAGDVIQIVTIEGSINISLLRKNVWIDYNYVVDEENDGYIQLVMGENIIQYEAESGQQYLNVTLEYKNQYLFA